MGGGKREQFCSLDPRSGNDFVPSAWKRAQKRSLGRPKTPKQGHAIVEFRGSCPWCRGGWNRRKWFTSHALTVNGGAESRGRFRGVEGVKTAPDLPLSGPGRPPRAPDRPPDPVRKPGSCRHPAQAKGERISSLYQKATLRRFAIVRLTQWHGLWLGRDVPLLSAPKPLSNPLTPTPLVR
jgi:hypothetical protein